MLGEIKKCNGGVKFLQEGEEYYHFLSRIKYERKASSGRKSGRGGGGCKRGGSYDPFTTAFKTPLLYRGDVERWACREATILWFAYAMHGFFETLSDKKLVLIAMPTSKPRDSALFNDRIDESLRALQNLGKYDVRFCIDRTCAQMPVFHGGFRNVKKIMQTSYIHDERGIPQDSEVFLVDDVIVTGAHFKAYKTMVAQHYGICEARIKGLFLARYKQA